MGNITTANIFSRIKAYRKLSHELQEVLSKNPDDTIRFQETFNSTVDKIYEDIMGFEKETIDKFELNVYKLKKVFEKRYRPYFLYGDYIKWCLKKPFGYAGDFKIIDDIYQNHPRTKGFDRLWDNWVMQLAVSKAVRERKEHFKKIIYEFVYKNQGRKIRIMSLGCGPAREIKELLELDNNKIFINSIFDCYDYDASAIQYAKSLMNNASNVNLFQKNAIRLALKKNIIEEIPCNYDLIYSAGLFDYFDERVAVRLVSNLKKVMRKNGIMVISNATEKYNNSSAIWMEWVGEWYLIYRTKEDFKKIFLNANFSSENIHILIQDSKVMQYCLAKT